MALVAERPHNKHGRSVFIRDGLKVNNISVCEEENVELIIVELSVIVHSMYKPPPEPFRLPTLGQRNKLHIVIGDFNSHSTPQQTATENMWSNVRTQTTCHSYTTRYYRNHSTVQFGSRDTTRISSLYRQTFRIYILSVYNPFSDRVGLPLRNIRTPSLPVMDMFSVDLKFCHVRLYTLQPCPSWSSNRSSSFNSILHTFLRPVLVTFPHHLTIPSQPTTSNDSCDRLNSNQLSLCFTCSVFQGNTTHPSNHLHLCSFQL